MTAYQYLKKSDADILSNIAIDYYGRKIRHRELLENIELVAQALDSLGIKGGDMVTICSVTIPEVIYLFYALNKMGAVANMVDPRVDTERFSQILSSTDSKYLFCLDLIWAKIESAVHKVNPEKCVIISATHSLPMGLRMISSHSKQVRRDYCINWNSFLKQKASKPIGDVAYIRDCPAAVVYTGGTTGSPKGAVITNDNFNAMAEAYRNCIPPRDKRNQKILNIMPPFIAYGLVVGIHMPLSLGVVNILIPKFDAEEFPKLLKKYKPNHTLGVPSHYSVLLESRELNNVDLSFWVNPAAGGDSMNSILEKQLNAFLEEHNCKSRMTKGYGMTELSGTAVSSSVAFNKYESVGIPFSKNNVGAFVPGTDIELSYGEIGEICITGPTVFFGYLDGEENQHVKKRHKDGKTWIHSQDYGYIDEDGYVFIKGRIKRMIVRPDGHNNYPMEMESVLNTYPGVLDSVVVGTFAKKYGNGQIPIAFVVFRQKQNAACIEEKMMDYCKEKLSKRDIPCGIIITKELPLTNIGKVDYKALEEVLESDMTSNTDLVEKMYLAYEDTLSIG